MIIFPVQDYYVRFAQALCDLDPEARFGRFEVMRYPDGELCSAVREGVEGKDCLLIGSIAPPDSQMLEVLLLAGALKRGGARTVKAFLPYLAYSRQDKLGPGQGAGIVAVGSLLKAAGVDSVITIDLHSELAKTLIGLPVASLAPAVLFAEEIRPLGWENGTIVAPDEGAIHRNELLREELGVEGSVVHLVKQHASIVHLGVVGDVGERAVLADDVLDSGRTLVSACNVLRQSGVKQIAVVATHGLFTGSIWRELFGLGITSLFVTDSCPQALKTEEPSVKVVSIKPLLPMVLAAARKEVSGELIRA